MNRGPWFQLQSLNEKAGQTETVKESWKDHTGFTEHFIWSLMYICLFTLWLLFLSNTSPSYRLWKFFYPISGVLNLKRQHSLQVSVGSSPRLILFYHSISFTACNLAWLTVVLCNTFISHTLTPGVKRLIFIFAFKTFGQNRLNSKSLIKLFHICDLSP